MSKIEWTEETWNPFVGCTLVSAGCTNCYAMALASRLSFAHYQGVTKRANGRAVWSGRLNRASDQQVQKPLRIKPPSLIFVNSMSDFFHPQALDAWRLEALGIMRATRHQYQILTKRTEEIAPFLARAGVELPRNVWLGATVERADVTRRLDDLRAVAASIRFVSVEPLIGPLPELDLREIQWLILGGESGPGYRPMRLEWALEVAEHCKRQGVALFVKQDSAFRSGQRGRLPDSLWGHKEYPVISA